MTRIDLNSDLGESFGRYTIGNDDQVLGLIAAANVACGFHAGDPDVMAKTVALAEAKGGAPTPASLTWGALAVAS